MSEQGRIDEARREGVVSTVIALYDRRVIPNGFNPSTRREEIRNILTMPSCGIVMDAKSVDFWLDELGVE